jgi:hypothetical protein
MAQLFLIIMMIASAAQAGVQLDCQICKLVSETIWNDASKNGVANLESRLDGRCNRLEAVMHAWIIESGVLRKKTMEEQGFKKVANPDGTYSLSFSDTSTLSSVDNSFVSSSTDPTTATAMKEGCNELIKVPQLTSRLAKLLQHKFAENTDENGEWEEEDSAKDKAVVNTHFTTPDLFGVYVCGSMAKLCPAEMSTKQEL